MPATFRISGISMSAFPEQVERLRSEIEVTLRACSASEKWELELDVGLRQPEVWARGHAPKACVPDPWQRVEGSTQTGATAYWAQVPWTEDADEWRTQLVTVCREFLGGGVTPRLI